MSSRDVNYNKVFKSLVSKNTIYTRKLSSKHKELIDITSHGGYFWGSHFKDLLKDQDIMDKTGYLFVYHIEDPPLPVIGYVGRSKNYRTFISNKGMHIQECLYTFESLRDIMVTLPDYNQILVKGDKLYYTKRFLLRGKVSISPCSYLSDYESITLNGVIIPGVFLASERMIDNILYITCRSGNYFLNKDDLFMLPNIGVLQNMIDSNHPYVNGYDYGQFGGLRFSLSLKEISDSFPPPPLEFRSSKELYDSSNRFQMHHLGLVMSMDEETPKDIKNLFVEWLLRLEIKDLCVTYLNYKKTIKTMN